jgi:hypothetical protein
MPCELSPGRPVYVISLNYYAAVTRHLGGRRTVPRMAPLVNRIIGAVRLGAQPLGTCVVCHDAIDVADESVSLSGGGRVHADCATYRMRHRARFSRREHRDGHVRYTGD